MSSFDNPFQSPEPDTRLPPPAQDPGAPSPYVPCPKCGAQQSKRVRYTWWGGGVGPKILTHVKCPLCHTAYNGFTGQSNAIIICWLVTIVLMGSVTALLFAFLILVS